MSRISEVSLTSEVSVLIEQMIIVSERQLSPCTRWSTPSSSMFMPLGGEAGVDRQVGDLHHLVLGQAGDVGVLAAQQLAQRACCLRRASFRPLRVRRAWARWQSRPEACAAGVGARPPDRRIGARGPRPPDEQHHGDDHQRQDAEEYVKAAVGVPRAGACAGARAGARCAGAAAARGRRPKAARRKGGTRRPGTGRPCAARARGRRAADDAGRCGGRRSDMISISLIVGLHIRTIIHALPRKST